MAADDLVVGDAATLFICKTFLSVLILIIIILIVYSLNTDRGAN